MNIIVFGAASAIAQATIRLWAERGYTLFLIDRNSERLKSVADDAKVRGAAAVHIHTADLTDTSMHPALIQEATQKLSGVDIAFIAYGTLGSQLHDQASFENTLAELQTNCLSVISLLTHLAPIFEEKKSGTIAVISSVAGDRGRQSNYVYGTAKGALTIFLQGLRHRLHANGAYVLTIKPGFVDTPMTKDFKKGLLWAKPEVIARGIVRAIDRHKHTVYLPWFWRYIMLIIRLIPEPIFLKTKL